MSLSNIKTEMTLSYIYHYLLNCFLTKHDCYALKLMYATSIVFLKIISKLALIIMKQLM